LLTREAATAVLPQAAQEPGPSDAWTFGISEVEFSGAPPEEFSPRTTVYVGTSQFSTSFSAYEVAAVGVLAALVLVAAVSYAVARFGRRPDAAG